MRLEWGNEGQLKFKDDIEYYKSLGVFTNNEITTISWEQNTQTGSYSDAYRLKIHNDVNTDLLPDAIQNALRSARRINNNSYVMNLLENHGFVMSGKTILASFENVINSIPNNETDNIKAFMEGYNILKKDTNNNKINYKVESIDVSDAILSIRDVPKLKKRPVKKDKKMSSVGKRDYIKKAIDDFEIGEAGEKVVYNYEKNKLKDAKDKGLIDDLKNKLEWVSQKDDSQGYDIRSYDPVEKKEMYIEVKTTTGPASNSFFMSENELEKSKKYGNDYYIYRLYNMERKKVSSVDCYIVKGDVSKSRDLKITSNGYEVELVINN